VAHRCHHSHQSDIHTLFQRWPIKTNNNRLDATLPKFHTNLTTIRTTEYCTLRPKRATVTLQPYWQLELLITPSWSAMVTSFKHLICRYVKIKTVFCVTVCSLKDGIIHQHGLVNYSFHANICRLFFVGKLEVIPGGRFSKAPETFRARKAIAKSRTLRLQSCFIHMF